MPPSSADLSLPVFLLCPPYDRYERIANIGALSLSKIPIACILALDVTSPTRDWSALRLWIPQLRSRFPAAPIILRVRHSAGTEVVHLTSRGKATRSRGIVGRGANRGNASGRPNAAGGPGA